MRRGKNTAQPASVELSGGQFDEISAQPPQLSPQDARSRLQSPLLEKANGLFRQAQTLWEEKRKKEGQTPLLFPY
jgi:hypothetical protein